ncbi:hypothetical protein GCM10010279_29120 [Streptomyces mutabilis]|nr:hypothetical protein GCM10010279_29120 [Streptomyces mutabilis]
MRSNSRIVTPARWSRRIAAYSSTFDICGMTRTFHRQHPDAVLASTPLPSKLVNITRPWKRAPPKPVYNRRHDSCTKPTDGAPRAQQVRGRD